MTIYSILERLEKLEKVFESELPVLSFKERLEKLELDITEIKKTIGID